MLNIAEVFKLQEDVIKKSMVINSKTMMNWTILSLKVTQEGKQPKESNNH